jgi:hypothetical protein
VRARRAPRAARPRIALEVPMTVMMQAFHWDCPRVDGQEERWWTFVRARIPALGAAGFAALWLPPVHKAANIGGPSMGYDPYDYYDLGDHDQKGRTPTWFGSRAELDALIRDAHDHRLRVIADMVINHNSGATRRSGTRSTAPSGGRGSPRRAAGSRATGNASTRRRTRRGTRRRSAACRTSATVTRTCTASCSPSPGGSSRRSDSTASGTTS